MIGVAACGEMRRALGVYVVGAIGPADRGAVDEHLAGCADCRDELAGLAGLPALLGRVPADEAAGLLLGRDPDPAKPALVALLDRAARLHGHRSWPRIAAAAAAGLIVGAGVVTAAGALDHVAAAGADRRCAAVDSYGHWRRRTHSRQH